MKRQPQKAELETLQLTFGVDTDTASDTVLQNGLSKLHWICRNQRLPHFWGRHINGEEALTLDEISYIHSLCCRIAVMYSHSDPTNMDSYDQGAADAKDAIAICKNLHISTGKAIFMQVDKLSNITNDYMLSYAKTLLENDYIPGFYANTDAFYDFSHQFARGYQAEPEVFEQCLIWATAPNLPEFYQTGDTHIPIPDYWGPYCPSCFTADKISIWQYGEDCYPIHNYLDKLCSFNINLIKDLELLEKMV